MTAAAANRRDRGVVHCEAPIGNGGGELTCSVSTTTTRLAKIAAAGRCGCCHGCACVKWSDYSRSRRLGWKLSACS
uniref:Uncharacterized protein n=1 Tax=Physcomitrium patens TaxID=3218 RepID=A0A2K1L7I5_PHYPA|nr:hypothetical protein PHYPA_000422 [Physcomitrium patens]